MSNLSSMPFNNSTKRTTVSHRRKRKSWLLYLNTTPNNHSNWQNPPSKKQQEKSWASLVKQPIPRGLSRAMGVAPFGAQTGHDYPAAILHMIGISSAPECPLFGHQRMPAICHNVKVSTRNRIKVQMSITDSHISPNGR